jgi:hypothetical protein
MLVLPSPPQRGEGNISNPRVLSDMGLAIPRPTRLGDPRSEPDPEFNSVSVCASSSNIILTSLRCCPFLRAALQLFAGYIHSYVCIPPSPQGASYDITIYLELGFTIYDNDSTTSNQRKNILPKRANQSWKQARSEQHLPTADRRY